MKEFREEYLSRVAVFVDISVPLQRRLTKAIRSENAAFEAALSMVAACAEHLDQRRYEIDLFLPGPKSQHLQSDIEQMTMVLGALASVEETPGSFLPLDRACLVEIALIRAALLVFTDWDEPREAMVRELQANGVATRVLVVSARRNISIPDDPDITLLRPDDVANGRATEL